MGILRIGRKEDPNRKKAPAINDANIAPLAKDQLGISDDAARRLDTLFAERAKPLEYFRVAIRGGGCSGLSLHFEFVSEKKAHDLIFNNNHINVVIDQKSLSILGGSTLHVREYLGAYEFVLVNNPAEKQCSCGKSFSI
jgi:iron-sulfur cluster assembly protein